MKLAIKSLLFMTLVIVSAFSNAMDNVKKSVMTIEQLEIVILNNEVDNKNNILKALSNLEMEYPADVNYLRGLMYFHGKIENKNVSEAVKYLNLAVELNHIEASYLLGSIFISFEPRNITSGIELLEIAAKNGHLRAMYNIFVLYKKGIYLNKAAAFAWIVKATSLGEENSSLIYANEIYSEAQRDKNLEKVKQAVNILESTKFQKLKGEAYFLLANIYNDSDFKFIENDQKRDKYLELSASEGFEKAKDLWANYQRLKDKKQLMNTGK
jgi:TPR repeat protein